MMEYTANSENKAKVLIFNRIEDMSLSFHELFISEYLKAVAVKKPFHLALSGGSTPVKLFENLSLSSHVEIDYTFLHLYWGDERCVTPDHRDSNYGNIRNVINKKFIIPEENFHRIHGEDDAIQESIRYSELLRNLVPSENGVPRFDMILLGIGDDGHTASIFPDSMNMLKTEKICYVAFHPQSGQKRITTSLKILNNSKIVLFLATGSSKAEVIESILLKKGDFRNYPAFYVKPETGRLVWFIDKEAGKNFTI